MLHDGVGGCLRIQDSAGLVLAGLQMEGSQPCFKQQALLGIIYPQGWASSGREV